MVKDFERGEVDKTKCDADETSHFSHEFVSSVMVILLTDSETDMVNNLTSSFYSASRMRLHKQAPETSLGAEVYHQTSLVIDTHAGRIQRTWQKYTQTDRILQKTFYNLMWISLSTETQSVIFWPSKELTLQFSLGGAADAVLPENGSVVHESEPQL